MALRALTLRRLVFRRFDDETLLAHVLEGQESAFSELHQRYRTIVYGYCLARLMDPSAAEDVTQDTFIRIHGARGSESIRSARAWIFSVTRSALVDHVRRQKRQPSYLSAEEELAVVSPGSDAAETAERREQAQSVFLAIARLRPRYRSALLLREMHGLTSVEIGEAMNLKPGAVDTLVSRARDAFGKEYSNLGDLPSTCRRAVEYMYRERGTGIDDDERMWLGDHVAGCARCARERHTARDARGLAVLLPLVGVRDGGFGFLTRAVETLGWAPASVDALSSLAAKATVIVLATTLAVAPVPAVYRPSRTPSPDAVTTREVAATQPVSSTRALPTPVRCEESQATSAAVATTGGEAAADAVPREPSSAAETSTTNDHLDSIASDDSVEIGDESVTSTEVTGGGDVTAGTGSEGQDAENPPGAETAGMGGGGAAGLPEDPPAVEPAPSPPLAEDSPVAESTPATSTP